MAGYHRTWVRLLALTTAASVIAGTGGCAASARDDYYAAHAIEIGGSGSDGHAVAAAPAADELRKLILNAHRVQLADVEK